MARTFTWTFPPLTTALACVREGKHGPLSPEQHQVATRLFEEYPVMGGAPNAEELTQADTWLALLPLFGRLWLYRHQQIGAASPEELHALASLRMADDVEAEAEDRDPITNALIVAFVEGVREAAREEQRVPMPVPVRVGT
jgi:hypothetical protein